MLRPIYFECERVLISKLIVGLKQKHLEFIQRGNPDP